MGGGSFKQGLWRHLLEIILNYCQCFKRICCLRKAFTYNGPALIKKVNIVINEFKANIVKIYNCISSLSKGQ